MQLAYETLLKLNNVSRTEMNIFLQCVRYQDDQGQVIGAYYRYFMKLLGFKSKQTFYNVLRSLSEKKLLTYAQNVKGDFDIWINNPVYSKQEKPDYIDLNKVIFQSKEFFGMKAHEKYMLLDLMRSTALNRGIRVIRVEEFYNKYCKALHVTKRVIQMYLCTLRKYFAVRIKEGKYYIKFLGGKLFEKPKRSAQGKRTTYIIDNTAADQQREYVGKNSTKTLVGSAYITKNDNWKVTWNNLLRNDGTTTYNYTAEEEAVPGYTGKMVWKGSYEAGRVGTLTNTLQSSAVKLLKTSSMPDVTNGNDCYSLKGAEYGVYSDSSLSGASKVGVLTTDENGESNTLTLNAGTYYVRETTAPKGYALDKTAYTITIKPNETYTLKVSDKPTLDPVGVLLGKVDKETNQNKPEGSLSLEGALFTAKFYAGVQSDSDPAADGKTADRTWVFRTNEDGFCYYEEKYLESGDELYLSPTKNPSLPIGTLTIQETQAPDCSVCHGCSWNFNCICGRYNNNR